MLSIWNKHKYADSDSWLFPDSKKSSGCVKLRRHLHRRRHGLKIKER